MFKDEAGEKQIAEVVGLRAKLYSYKMINGSEDKKGKGCQRMLQKGVFNSMTIESACQQEGTTSKNECHTKQLYKIYTEEIYKIGLSSDDDKRSIMADGIHTLAYGHTNFKKM